MQSLQNTQNMPKIDEVWSSVQEFLFKQTGTNTELAQTMLYYLKPSVLDEENFILSTNLPVAKQWVDAQFLQTIADALLFLLGSDRKVSIIVIEEEAKEGATQSSAVQTVEAAAPSTTTANMSASVPVATTSSTSNMPTNNDQTFESFIVGDSNNFAFGTARGVAESPGEHINPLFIYGKSGLGKTHLLLAINNYILRHHQGKRVVYVDTKEFINDFANSFSREGSQPFDFNGKYYNCDVLLLDDIQELEGAEGTIKALFDLFNRFINNSKQIVLSADRAPNEIKLDNRFTSRFASGVTADIQIPSFEMKLAIFNNFRRRCCLKFGLKDVELAPSVAEHLISLSSSNIRELEGATLDIVFSALDSKIDLYQISTEEIDLISQKVFVKNAVEKISIAKIQSVVELFYNLKHEELLGPSREQRISQPRQIAMYLSRLLTTESLPEIGKLFGGKDHSAVIYAAKNIEKKQADDKTLRKEIKELTSRVKNS